MKPDSEKQTFGTFLLPLYHPFRLMTNIVFWANMFLVTTNPPGSDPFMSLVFIYLIFRLLICITRYTSLEKFKMKASKV